LHFIFTDFSSKKFPIVAESFTLFSPPFYDSLLVAFITVVGLCKQGSAAFTIISFEQVFSVQPKSHNHNMATSFEWPPLESNPEVFTKYLHDLGVSDKWAVGEVYGFDEDLLAFLPQPVIGVIVNVEILKREEDKARGSEDTSVDFYMKQSGTLDNACGIIACLHATLNNLDSVDLKGDSILHNFHTRTKELSPEERAAFLENDNAFKSQHESAAGEGQSGMSASQEDVKHHFIAYTINRQKQLVEYDGTKRGPHVVAEGCDDVLRGSIAEVQRKLAEAEISESLCMMTLNATA
jgi:ubiquitin carboxyl-terminal hydrolase L3